MKLNTHTTFSYYNAQLSKRKFPVYIEFYSRNLIFNSIYTVSITVYYTEM